MRPVPTPCWGDAGGTVHYDYEWDSTGEALGAVEGMCEAAPSTITPPLTARVRSWGLRTCAKRIWRGALGQWGHLGYWGGGGGRRGGGQAHGVMAPVMRAGQRWASLGPGGAGDQAKGGDTRSGAQQQGPPLQLWGGTLLACGLRARGKGEHIHWSTHPGEGVG